MKILFFITFFIAQYSFAESVPDSIFCKRVIPKEKSFLLIFGEQHGYYCNTQIEIKWTKQLTRTNDLNTILVEYSPEYALWLKLKISENDSLSIYNLFQHDIVFLEYMQFLFNKFRNRKVDDIPIYGISDINNLDLYFRVLVDYIERIHIKEKRFEMLNMLAQKGLNRRKTKKLLYQITKLYQDSFTQNNSNYFDLKFLLNSLCISKGKKFKHYDSARDLIMSKSIEFIYNRNRNFRGILFSGKFHTPKTIFSYANKTVKPMNYYLHENRKLDSLNIVTILFSYCLKTSTQTSTMEKKVEKFQNSFLVPCIFTDKLKSNNFCSNLNSNSSSGLIYINKNCADFIIYLKIENKSSSLSNIDKQ